MTLTHTQQRKKKIEILLKAFRSQFKYGGEQSEKLTKEIEQAYLHRIQDLSDEDLLEIFIAVTGDPNRHDYNGLVKLEISYYNGLYSILVSTPTHYPISHIFSMQENDFVMTNAYKKMRNECLGEYEQKTTLLKKWNTATSLLEGAGYDIQVTEY